MEDFFFASFWTISPVIRSFLLWGAVLRRILCGEPASAPLPHRSSSLQARPFGAAPATYGAPGEPYIASSGEPHRAGARSPAARPPTSAAVPAAAATSGAAASAAAASAVLGNDWVRLSTRLALLQQQVRARH